MRIRAIPRLRQRLTATAFGAGRPIWVDDAGFDIDDHLNVRACPAPGDEAALLACATDIVGTKLPSGRPPWSATFVTGVERDRTALVIVFNHVLADGIGGLAVLASLVDGMPDPVPYGFPRPAPSRRAVVLDATSSRLRALPHAGRGLATMRAAIAELKQDGRSAAPRTSLNLPSRTRRSHQRRACGSCRGAFDRARPRCDGERRRARGCHGGASRIAPESWRTSESLRRVDSDLGAGWSDDQNSSERGGVLPVDLPASGDFDDRVRAITRITREHKRSDGHRGSSAALVGPFFRALARVGLCGRSSTTNI